MKNSIVALYYKQRRLCHLKSQDEEDSAWTRDPRCEGFVYINLHIVSSSLLENSTYYIPTYMYPSIHFLPPQIFKGKSFLHTLFYFILSPKIFIMNSVYIEYVIGLERLID